MGRSTGSLSRVHPITSISVIYHSEFLLAGKEDAANNIAHGHYIAGKETFDKVNDHLSKMVDNCDTVQGFIMKHSVGGGTGSARGCSSASPSIIARNQRSAMCSANYLKTVCL